MIFMAEIRPVAENFALSMPETLQSISLPKFFIPVIFRLGYFKPDYNLFKHQNSSLKNLIADTNGLLAACPKPHIDASCIVAANSESK